MEEIERLPARLTLRAQGSKPAELEVRGVPARKRRTRALGYLLGCWILIPIVAFIPPHIPWVLAAFFLGIYFFYRNWTGEYVVEHFEGHCPRCDNLLTIEKGTKLKLPHKMICNECHFEPTLEVATG
jgi:hypothetical protein